MPSSLSAVVGNVPKTELGRICWFETVGRHHHCVRLPQPQRRFKLGPHGLRVWVVLPRDGASRITHTNGGAGPSNGLAQSPRPNVKMALGGFFDSNLRAILRNLQLLPWEIDGSGEMPLLASANPSLIPL